MQIFEQIIQELLPSESPLALTSTLYSCYSDNFGRPRTLRQILFTDFANNHRWFYKDNASGKWVSGSSNDLFTMIELRSLDSGQPTYDAKKIEAKQTVQCWTPSARYKVKGKKAVLLYLLPFLQLDIDQEALQDYDIEEVKQMIFSLPFVFYVGKSFSARGLFALVLIAEPDKLSQYAEHCFNVFAQYGITVDTSKGRNYSDLRYVSYDANCLYREDPIPLKIKQFNVQPQKETVRIDIPISDNPDRLINFEVRKVREAQPGARFITIRSAAFALGGIGRGLTDIEAAILSSSQYSGVTEKYLTHAREGFEAGMKKPFAIK
jgi:hypothetical protein